MYGMKQFTRLNKDEFRYVSINGAEYTYVTCGFFKVVNFVRPFPLGALYVVSTCFWALFIYRVLVYKVWTRWLLCK